MTLNVKALLRHFINIFKQSNSYNSTEISWGISEIPSGHLEQAVFFVDL